MLERTPRGRAACTVTIEGKHDFTHQPEDPFEVFRCCRSTEGRNSIIDAVLMQPHRVHVTFDDQQTFEVGAGATGFEQCIQLASLVEEHRLRRVEVLRLALVEDASAERDDSTSAVPYRKHDAVAKAVIVSIPLSDLT